MSENETVDGDRGNLSEDPTLLADDADKTELVSSETRGRHADAWTYRSAEPGVLIGPYKIVERLGHGGMGEVWLAEQLEPVKRNVALKIIKAGMDSHEVMARFDAERQALALMDHPNIARVFDAGTTDRGLPYFVMELVEGPPITGYCDTRQLGIKERLKLFIDACRGLRHAHQKGIIHRDIKPSNILVAEHDGKPVPKLIDFGIVKATNQQLTEQTLFTQVGQIMGTPAYMSPEQASGGAAEDVDTRTDIYALGVVLFELLTGSTPLRSRELKNVGMGDMMRMISESEAPRPSTRLKASEGEIPGVIERRGAESLARLRRRIRGDLDWIVMRALENDRDRRYESVSELAADCERFLNSEPVEASPPSAIYILSKFARRNRAALAIAVSIVAALVISAASSIWIALRETQVRKQSQQQIVTGVLRAIGQEENDPTLSEQEIDALWELSTLAPGQVGARKLFLENALSSEASARQLHNRLDHIVQGLVGLNEDYRQEFLAIANRVFFSADKQSEVQRASAEILSRLTEGDSDAIRTVSQGLLDEMNKETDLEQLCKTAQTLEEFGSGLPKAIAFQGSHRLLEAIRKDATDPESDGFFVMDLPERFGALVVMTDEPQVLDIIAQMRNELTKASSGEDALPPDVTRALLTTLAGKLPSSTAEKVFDSFLSELSPLSDRDHVLICSEVLLDLLRLSPQNSAHATTLTERLFDAILQDGQLDSEDAEQFSGVVQAAIEFLREDTAKRSTARLLSRSMERSTSNNALTTLGDWLAALPKNRAGEGDVPDAPDIQNDHPEISRALERGIKKVQGAVLSEAEALSLESLVYTLGKLTDRRGYRVRFDAYPRSENPLWDEEESRRASQILLERIEQESSGDKEILVALSGAVSALDYLIPIETSIDAAGIVLKAQKARDPDQGIEEVLPTLNSVMSTMFQGAMGIGYAPPHQSDWEMLSDDDELDHFLSRASAIEIMNQALERSASSPIHAHELDLFRKAIRNVGARLSDALLLETFKFPHCIGEARTVLVKLLEERTGLELSSARDLAAHAIQIGFDPNSPPSRPKPVEF